MASKSAKGRGVLRHALVGAYERGGLLYFNFDGQEMVAVVRDRKSFDKHWKDGTTLKDYVQIDVGVKGYDAAKAIEALITDVSN